MTHSDQTDDTWKHSPFAPGTAADETEKDAFDDLDTEAKVNRLAAAVERQAELLEQMATAQGITQQAAADASANTSDGVWKDSPFSNQE